MSHAPVLLHEAVAALAPKAGDLIVDATFGGGGYTRALLEAADCKVVALDRDPDAIARAQAFARLAPWRLAPRQGRFGDIETLVPEPVDAVALDLGVSSFQLDHIDPKRPTMSQKRSFEAYLQAWNASHIVAKCYECIGLEYQDQGMDRVGNSRKYKARA